MIDLPHTTPLLTAASLAAVGVALVWMRRRRLGGVASILLCATMALLALSAGGLRLAWPDGRPVRVLVDESRSTRTAEYHDAGWLHARMRELIGGRAYVVERFGKDARRTRMPAITEPTLLFTDGQFAQTPPAAAPVYPVISTALSESADHRVVDVVHERGRAIVITERAGVRERVLLGSAFEGHVADVDADDAWPENNRVALPAAPRPGVHRWASGIAPPAGHTPMGPDALPSAASGYTATALLVLDAGVVPLLTPAQQAAIVTWVRELGGSLLLVGGSPAWTALRGTAIEEASPLSVDPPRPVREWVILLDASGSMSQPVDGRPQWQHGLAAAVAARQSLPPHDVVRFGTFSDQVRWWRMGAANDIDLALPREFVSRGPTSLRAALQAVMALPPAPRRELLLLTDAEIEPSEAQAPAEVRVHALALADGRGLAALRAMTEATGGRFAIQTLPGGWADAARELARQAGPSRWETHALQVGTTAPMPEAQLEISGWNMAFPRPGTHQFAAAENAVLGASWRFGLGRVTTLAWPAEGSALATLAGNVEQLPTDGRYEVTWSPGRVRIELLADDAPTNLLVYCWPGMEVENAAIERVSPGVLEARLPAHERPMSVVITTSNTVVAQRILLARYAEEFERIGINRPALEELARQSGGRIIEANDRNPLEITQRTRFVALWPALLLAAMAAASASLLLLRRRV